MYTYTYTLWHKWKYWTWCSSSHFKYKGLIIWFIEQGNVMSCHVMKNKFIPQCCCCFGGRKTTCDFYLTLQQVQRGQINFALCSKTWENLSTIMSVFTVNYIILSLSRGFPPLNRNLFLLNRGYHSATSLAPALLTPACDLFLFWGTQ